MRDNKIFLFATNVNKNIENTTLQLLQIIWKHMEIESVIQKLNLNKLIYFITIKVLRVQRSLKGFLRFARLYLFPRVIPALRVSQVNHCEFLLQDLGGTYVRV